MPRNPKKASRLRRAVLYLIDDVAISTYLITFFAVVAGSGFLYYFLTPCGHGMGRDSSALHATSVYNGLYNGLYLSFVTISSLGYSDIHPMGFSKVLACIEVLMGMALSGILIARIASRRLSFHVSRMYGSYTRDYLDKMSATFCDIANDLRAWGSDYSKIFDAVGSENNVRAKADVFRNFEQTSVTIENCTKSLHEYVSQEVNESDYFRNAPADLIVELGRSLETTFSILGQILIGLSTQSRIEILHGSVRRRIGRATRLMLEISDVVRQHKRASDSLGVQRVFADIGRVCSALFVKLGETPERDLPNQITRKADNPNLVEETVDESERMW